MGERVPSRLTVGGRELALVRSIGRGASSVVWLAEDPVSGARAAIKVARDPAERGRLAREAERLLFAESRALASLLDVGMLPADIGPNLGLADRAPYVALEWVDGTPLPLGLDEQQRGPLALSVARDLGEALEDLHALGAAHGDIKPQNVLVVARSSQDDSGIDGYSARLVDLGLSTETDSATPEGGTLRYMAPEVFRGSGPTGDARARDLWALGVVLAEVASSEIADAEAPPDQTVAERLQGPLGRIVRALLAPLPGARPSAGWVRRQALGALGEVENENAARARRRSAVRRAYLAVRRHEVLTAARHDRASIAVAGQPGRWLTEAVELASRAILLQGTLMARDAASVRELDALGRSRWLVALCGTPAAAWPQIGASSDAELAELLLTAVERCEPRSLTLGMLQGPHSRPAADPPDDPIELAVRLTVSAQDPRVVDAAERIVFGSGAPPALGVALGAALRLRGEYGRALTVLRHVGTPAARVEAAEAARRVGDSALVRELLEGPWGGWDDATLARRTATLARLKLDAGDPRGALELLGPCAPTAATLETRALAELALGDLEAANVSEQLARLDAAGDEQHARISAVAGSIAHASGDAQTSLECYRRAAERAARAGAVLEEATYLSGISAAAALTGDLGEALSASQRAMLLFEHLGRAHDAAYAALARTVAYAQAGAAVEAREAAADALLRAKAAGDQRCRAYVHWALADVAPSSTEGAEHGQMAMSLIEQGTSDDQLRAAVRLLDHQEDFDPQVWDRLARQPSIAIDARLEWWGSRARAEVLRSPSPGAPAVLLELAALAAAPAAATIRGPALAAGAQLAARIGDGETAWRLTAAAGEDAAELLKRAPPELRTSLAGLGWIASLQRPAHGVLVPEQLSDVEALLRTLSRRDRLRPLLDQVLDALVLWTGVERGLLLLRAPRGRLVARAARNLAREDLVGHQRELSYSLAEKALEQREPIVAVDAAGELPELQDSVHALKLRSVLAVPLVARGEALGVVYLDDRVRRGAFGTRELAWVRLVAALASVAIADARDQLLLRRSARRARRAEARVAGLLARSEAELDHAERELARAREDRETRFPYDDIIGNSLPIREMLRLVDRVTATDVPVLLGGESGSGKELVARAIHRNGQRRDKPFVTENCAAIPESLLESALFGHVKGAFTGAVRQRSGLFEIADSGTLFLDEVGEMSLGMQAKLLRVLEKGEFRPLGSERSLTVDVRIIAATHRDLRLLVEQNAFRADLFYRLDVVHVRIPPLRERASDIPLLVRHFVQRYASDRRVRVSRQALDVLCSSSWPGNVRQLENEVRRALVLADDVVEPHHLSRELIDGVSASSTASAGLDVRQRVAALETALLQEALALTSGNQTRAAQMLGLSRFGLQKMLKRLGVEATTASAFRPNLGRVGR